MTAGQQGRAWVAVGALPRHQVVQQQEEVCRPLVRVILLVPGVAACRGCWPGHLRTSLGGPGWG
jgi:hypothetical protein